jgi:antitoxin component YwqK of YwqJK toxin-antitoxin module
MLKFGFEKIKALTGSLYNVHQLSINGVNQLDKFEKELEGTVYLSQYKTLLRWIDYYSNTGNLPAEKLKELITDKKGIKEFEFRAKDLRIYAVQGDNGKIVIFCGYKSNQPKDISKFRALKSQIF